MLGLHRKAINGFRFRLAMSAARRFVNNTQGPSTSKRSYYEVLGVSKNATSAEIKNAFLALSKKYHPDVRKDDKSAHEQFVEINEAYTVLSKPDTRREYDAKLTSGQRVDHADERWPPSSDPVDEMYRRYFNELYKRRYPRDSQQQQYSGQRQDSPFRDFRRDPPIWPESDRRYPPGPGPYTRFSFRVGPRKGINFIRLYLTLVLLSFIISAFFDFILRDPHRRPPFDSRESGEDTAKLEKRWKHIKIFHEGVPMGYLPWYPQSGRYPSGRSVNMEKHADDKEARKSNDRNQG